MTWWPISTRPSTPPSHRVLIHLDYDGVIVDSFDSLLGLLQRAQREIGAGRPPVADDLRLVENLTFGDLAHRIGMPLEKRAEFAARLHRLQMDAPHPEIFDGIDEAILSLARRHTLVIVTASHADPVRGTLESCGMLGRFEEILGAETGVPKDQRIRDSLLRYGADARESWMVGDAISDLRLGKLAGVRTAAVGWGYQPRQALAAENPDLVIDLPGQLRLLESVG